MGKTARLRTESRTTRLVLQAADGRRTSASTWSCLERLKLHQLGERCGLTTLSHEEQLAIRYACGHEFGEGPVGLFLATLFNASTHV